MEINRSFVEKEVFAFAEWFSDEMNCVQTVRIGRKMQWLDGPADLMWGLGEEPVPLETRTALSL